MRKWMVLLALGLAAASAYGIGMGVGAFYTLSMPVGDAGEDYEMSIIGFGGEFHLGVLPALDVNIGFDYNMKYKQKELPAAPPAPLKWDEKNWHLTSIPITFGASYKFNDLGKVVPYVGAGGAFAMMKTHTEILSGGGGANPTIEAVSESTSKPGVYAGGGVMFRIIADKLFLDANPRWTMIMDKVEDDPATTPDETKANSQYVDVRIGVDYFFM